MEQNYANHRRVYPAHHFIFYPLALALLVVAIRGFIKDDTHQWLWGAVTGGIVLLIWLSFMVRQHYGMIMQNRLVRLEMRFRYYVITQQRFEPLEQQLSFGQIAALRFASDKELPALIQRAIAEKLGSSDIKKLVQDWQPDHMRI